MVRDTKRISKISAANSLKYVRVLKWPRYYQKNVVVKGEKKRGKKKRNRKKNKQMRKKKFKKKGNEL